MIRAVALVALLAGTAAAFPTGEQFELDALTEDGGGGVAFTGAPRWAGHACEVCHLDAPHQIGLALESDRPAVFVDGYEPGVVYRLRVAIEDEWAAAAQAAVGDACGEQGGGFVRCDDNGFAIELDDARGRAAGRLAPATRDGCAGTPDADADARIFADGSAATHSGVHHGQTSWDLCWTAPAAGAGVITAYVAAVDGNGGSATLEDPSDAAGDDVFAGAVAIPERGGAPTTESAGCDAGGAGGLGVILLILAATPRRRRRGAVAVVAVALAAGCVTVRPQERELMAERKMVFAPDPAEDELDLHMQEAREGSAGGYGNAGGGCGCN